MGDDRAGMEVASHKPRIGANDVRRRIAEICGVEARADLAELPAPHTGADAIVEAVELRKTGGRSPKGFLSIKAIFRKQVSDFIKLIWPFIG